MLPRTLLIFVSCLVLAMLAQGRAGAQVAGLAAWVADPLTKILPDSQAPEAPPQTVAIAAALGEYESGQIGLRPEVDLTGLKVEVSPLRSAPEAELPAEALRAALIGYVRLEVNTGATPEAELIATAPCEIPDPLMGQGPIDVPAGRAQAVWLTAHIPRDAEPGDYTATVSITCDQGETTMPVEVTVWPFEVPEERHLQYTNWINAGAIAQHHGVEMWSEPYWAMLEQYVKIAGEHRQTMLWVGVGSIAITEEENGEYSYDFAQFDRWVETCERHGVADRIEIQQVGGFEENWNSETIVLHPQTVTVRATGEQKRVPGREILPHLLPALQEHLRERGWLERAMLHVCDEPSQHNTASWSEVADFLKECAPEIRRIDAIEGPYFHGHLEVWVPKLTHLRNWWPIYQGAQEQGAEMWFYTCCHPMGLYPNRFLDYSLDKTRVLHWYNWRFGLPGYLHWGLNFWTDDPYTEVTRGGLPPGDCYIVYPGPDGPRTSIRWEALRDGIEDYEYLWVLADRTRAALEQLGGSDIVRPEERSDEIARGVVRDFLDYGGAEDMRSAREQLASEIVQLEEAPLLVVATDPPTWQPLVEGPIVVSVRGIAERGSTVKVNGQAAKLNERGEFVIQARPSLGEPSVRVEAELGGRTKTTVRRWPVLESRP